MRSRVAMTDWIAERNGNGRWGDEMGWNEVRREVQMGLALALSTSHVMGWAFCM
jgi:hypothetical protein